jgi:beta-lactamase regulating signal transducer with metallopeptidase domain
MSILHHLVWALVNSIWQSGVLAALVFLAIRSVRRSTAAQRHAVWSAVLLGCALLPAFDFALSEGWISARAGSPLVAIVIPYRGEIPTLASPLRKTSSSASLTNVQTQQATLPARGVGTAWNSPTVGLQDFGARLARISSSFAALFAGRYDVAALIVWFLAANLLIVRLLIGYQGLRIVKRGLAYRELTEREWEDFYGMTSRTIAIGYSSTISEPCVIGFATPVIALPVNIAERLSPDDAIRIMRHECAHISRWDDYSNLFKQVVSALVFFNPVVYFVSLALDVDREIACDDAVALAQTDRIDFAKCLFEIASSSTNQNWAPAAGLIRGKRQIAIRIKELLDANHSGATRVNAFAKLGALAVVAGAVAFAYVQITASAAPNRPAMAAVPLQPDSSRVLAAKTIVVPPVAMASKRTTVTIAKRTTVAEPAVGGRAVSAREAIHVWGVAKLQIPPKRIAAFARAGAVAVRARADARRTFASASASIAAHLRMVRLKMSQMQHAIAVERVAVVTASGQTVMTDAWFSVHRAGVANAQPTTADGRDALLQALDDAGFNDTSMDDLTAIRDARVSADFLQELHAAGLTPMPVAQLVELSSAGVDAAFLARICKTAYNNLTVEDFIRLGNAGVDPDFLNSLAGLGYHLSASDIVRLADNDVDPHYLAALARLGYQNLSVNDLVSLNNSGVDARYVASLTQLGYQKLSVGDLIRLSKNGVTADFIARLNASGVDSSHQISVDDLIKLHGEGI